MVLLSLSIFYIVLIQMGSSSSTPAPIQAPTFDYAKAKIDVPDFEAYEDAVKARLAQASSAVSQATSSAGSYMGWVFFLGSLLLIGVVMYVGWYFIFPALGAAAPNPFDSASNTVIDLSITSAEVINGSDKKDITPTIVGMISKNNELHISVDDRIGVTTGGSLHVNYQYTGEEPKSQTILYGKPLDIIRQPGAGKPGKQNPYFTSPGNLLANPKDAKEMSTITVPVNAEGGTYGYQFWMYVTDWNYKYGQEKHIMSREDPTNSAIMNPMVSLHPTDNKLKVSVSVFGSDSSKAEPAPAGHSGATDDVFICEVPNIPLQTWLSVGVTVSTRNLDVYLNGKLVKSCFLTGVPKPVSGNVTLNKDGGFSGWMCSFFHYPKLLIPSDTQAFFKEGVPCSVPGTSTNYKVTFGVRDTKGEVVSNYMF